MKPAKVVVLYIAVANGPITEDYAARFVTTYREYPGGHEHDLMIVANGGALPTSAAVLFQGLNARMWPHANDDGWDVSAYIDAAKGPCATYDMMVCLGESVYFHREGWLRRLAQAWNTHGPGMYGPYASNTIRGHLNTTAFCCHPFMLKNYPKRVVTRPDRYEFEHGEHALWRRLNERGVPVRMVTWDGEWDHRSWRTPRNILWRGDQSNLLVWCNHSDRFAEADAKVRQSWLRTCDQPFR